MKKLTLIAAAAAMAMGANAQYNVAPEINEVLDNHSDAAIFDAIILDGTTISDLETKGKTVNAIGPDDTSRFLYWWAGLTGGDGSYPGVDWHTDGYTSLTVTGTAGWSGAGFFIAGPVQDKPGDATGTGADFKHFTDATRFHMAYRTESTFPSAFALIILDGKSGTTASGPAKVALGDAYNDNGAVFPAIGTRGNDEWQAVDISFADLKKIYPAFSYLATDKWQGNVLSFLAGNVAGQNFALDATYFYSPSNSDSVEGVEAANEAELVVTSNTINAAGASSIVLYDLTGKTVKTAASSVLGINDVAKGIYIVKADNTVKKVVIK